LTKIVNVVSSYLSSEGELCHNCRIHSIVILFRPRHTNDLISSKPLISFRNSIRF